MNLGQNTIVIFLSLQAFHDYMCQATNSTRNKPHTVYLSVLTSVVPLQPVSILHSIAALITVFRVNVPEA